MEERITNNDERLHGVEAHIKSNPCKEVNDALMKELKRMKKKMRKDKPGGRLPNTKAAIKMSLNKEIDGKTLIAMVTYILLVVAMRVYSFLYPTLIDPFWEIFGDMLIGIVIWVICLLFNIKNPGVAKVFRDIGVWIMDLTLDPEDAMKELRIWFAALNQRYMLEFDKTGEKIATGVIKVDDKKEAIPAN